MLVLIETCAVGQHFEDMIFGCKIRGDEGLCRERPKSTFGFQGGLGTGYLEVLRKFVTPLQVPNRSLQLELSCTSDRAIAIIADHGPQNRCCCGE